MNWLMVFMAVLIPVSIVIFYLVNNRQLFGELKQRLGLKKVVLILVTGLLLVLGFFVFFRLVPGLLTNLIFSQDELVKWVIVIILLIIVVFLLIRRFWDRLRFM